MSTSCFHSVVPANGCFLLFVQHHKHGITSQACAHLGLHLALGGSNGREIGGFVTCNDVSIGKVDLAEVSLRLLPHWPPIKRTGRQFVTVGDSWLRLLMALRVL